MPAENESNTEYAGLIRSIKELHGDIYAQPYGEDNHKRWTEEVLSNFLSKINANSKTVLDVGCGQGIAEPMFSVYGWTWVGVTLGEDYKVCKDKGLAVVQADMLDMPMFDNNSFEIVYSRHSAEHSPAPLPMLMEWQRIARAGLIFVVPKPQLEPGGTGEILSGLNHYSLLTQSQWEALLGRAGWLPIWEDKSEPAEVRLYCQKYPRNKAPTSPEELLARIAKEWGRPT